MVNMHRKSIKSTYNKFNFKNSCGDFKALLKIVIGIFLTSRNVNNSCIKNFNGLSLPEHLLAIKKH